MQHVWKLLRIGLIASLCIAVPAMAQSQRAVFADGILRGTDGLAHPANVELTLQHSSEVPAKLAMRNAGLFGLRRIELQVVNSGASFEESYMFACIAPISTRPGGDEVATSFTAVPSQSHWVRQNMGRFVVVNLDILPPNTQRTAQS